MRGVESRTRVGRALRALQVVADDIEVIETVEVGRTPVDIPGTGRRDFKPWVRHHPTTIRFRSVVDPRFRAELERLAAAATDVEAGRRDRRWLPAPFDIVLEDEVSLAGVIVKRPLNGYGAIEQIGFGASLPEL